MIEIAPVSKDTLPFDEAWLYVLLLDYNNKKDWRLPTFDEILENDSLQVGVWIKNTFLQAQIILNGLKNQ